MAGFAPLWKRDAHKPTDRQADVLFVCFSAGPLSEGPALQPARFGVPSKESVDLLDVRRQERGNSAEVFDGWRAEPLRTIARRDLGDDLHLLDAATECHLVRVQLKDPPDLSHLQAAWAVARWMCARGATVVLDGHAARFWKGEMVSELPADAEFDIRREVSFIFETEPTYGDTGHYVHTRGMVKMARPDVVAVCSVDDADVVVEMVKELSAGMARGLVPQSTRQGVKLGANLSLYLGDPTPDLDVDRLHLNNDATLLSLEGGQHLTGVVQRLREAEKQ